MIVTSLKRLGGRLLLSRAAFTALQAVGLSLVRTRESPVPDLALLKADRFGEKESSLPGLEINESRQLAFLPTFKKYMSECEFAEIRTSSHEFCIPNDSFGFISAVVLHSMVRHFKPKTIIEVGAGNSTFVSARASVLNAVDGINTNLVVIEPYPKSDVFRRGFPGLGRLIEKRAETVELSLFEGLVPGDILFIDGSHYSRPGGDANFLVLEVIPRLAPGVLIHIHDIFLPEDYPAKWILEDRTFYNEQYLVQAFLCFNRGIEVLWAERYMKLKHSREVQGVFRKVGYRENHVSNSLWMRRI